MDIAGTSRGVFKLGLQSRGVVRDTDEFAIVVWPKGGGVAISFSWAVEGGNGRLLRLKLRSLEGMKMPSTPWASLAPSGIGAADTAVLIRKD